VKAEFPRLSREKGAFAHRWRDCWCCWCCAEASEGTLKDSGSLKVAFTAHCDPDTTRTPRFRSLPMKDASPSPDTSKAPFGPRPSTMDSRPFPLRLTRPKGPYVTGGSSCSIRVPRCPDPIPTSHTTTSNHAKKHSELAVVTCPHKLSTPTHSCGQPRPSPREFSAPDTPSRYAGAGRAPQGWVGVLVAGSAEVLGFASVGGDGPVDAVADDDVVVREAFGEFACFRVA